MSRSRISRPQGNLDNPAKSYTTGLTASVPYFPASITTVERQYKIPTSAQWSIGIQHQLQENVVLGATYVGNSNYHQSQGVNINSLAENDPHRLGVCGGNCGYTGTQLNANLYRPYQGWGAIAPMQLSANSNYNSLQVSLRATAWKNLTVNSNYTWSHAFDIIDGEIFSNVNNPFNTRWDYGPSGFDRRHISLTSFIYTPKVFQNSGSRLVKTALSGWEISGIALFETGNPVSIGAGPDNLGLGGTTGNRANVVAPITYPGTRLNWFSTSSFAKPGPLQFGSASRNDVVTPGRNNWNVALFKAFHFRENARFEFRAETFNTFNHTQLNSLQTPVTSGTFGQLTGASSPRILQLGAKLLF